jgi:predicted DNA-binding antitoxin AbrB/MazE fold protein
MAITVAAVYEDGVLKPEVPLGLKDKSKVTVTIEGPQGPKVAADDPTGWKAIDALRGIGKAVAPDVSTRHDDHLYGDPRD